MLVNSTSFNCLFASSRAFVFCLLTSVLSPVTTLAATEKDDYLSAITAEAEKVEKDAPTVSNLVAPAESTQGDGSQDRFEADLKAKYRGSYTFYRKLPRRSREEIFQDYVEGSSIDEIRKKIMDRFLSQ